MKKTEESLRRRKMGKKSAFSLFGTPTTKDDEGRDEERIRMQMILDVVAFGKDAELLGIDTGACESFQGLLEMVYANDCECAMWSVYFCSLIMFLLDIVPDAP